MFNKKTIKDVDLRGKVVLVRADYNVPIEYDAAGEARILNDFRIRASVPTLKYLLENGARKVVILAHLGRPNSVDTLADIGELEKLPNGKRKFSLRPVFNRLREILAEEYRRDLSEFEQNFPMNFHTTPIFAHSRYSTPIAQADDNYKIEMLENLRFSKDEKRNSKEFAESLLQLTGADLFVQDGFGVVHRAHTSTDQLPRKMQSVAGFLLEKEVSTITRAFENPERPFVAVMGGAKISDKLPLIEQFIQRADKVILGGALANSFLNFHEFEIGKSLIEAGQNEIIKEIEQTARQKFGADFRGDFLLPADLGVAREKMKTAERFEKDLKEIENADYILDIGEEFSKYAAEILASAKTIVWNGTLGVAEFENFAEGSNRAARAISQTTKNGATSIIGGGDTSAFILKWIQENPDLAEFSLISTGGGAALELMSGNILPGLEVLPDK
ncbi:MAG: phosphoglycerate kinase [bacterium]|nr:phosphoglycerate kinase [bacterium]